MTDFELVCYLLVFGITIIFSAFSIERKSSIFSFLSMMFWFILAIVHVGIAGSSSFIHLAYLFGGVAFFFLVYGFALILSSLKADRSAKEWELP